jgi:carbamoyl-phosphate synthase small subunit
MPKKDVAIQPHANACLMLADGTIFFGESIGAQSVGIGEICFNTGMTGYQETLTDPSYAGQIITFTFPHVGNIGCNDEDIEAKRPFCAGLVLRERPTVPSNFRSEGSLEEWLKANNLPGICGVDTRALTRYIRQNGAQNAMIVASHEVQNASKKKKLLEQLKAHPSMEGLDLAKVVTTKKPYEWSEGLWSLAGRKSPSGKPHRVVAIDYGEKLNILRSLAERGLKVTVVPATTPAEEILKMKPDGIFLSNGPGDPAATGKYAVPVLQKLIASGTPIFGICLGHQLLGLALGGKTEKLKQGHRGANQPVKNLETGNVEITSQNHGFAVMAESLPKNVKVTHVSLFDGSNEGLRCLDKPVFSVQYHPESSPGPHDSQYLFDQFVKMMERP